MSRRRISPAAVTVWIIIPAAFWTLTLTISVLAGAVLVFGGLVGVLLFTQYEGTRHG